MKNNEKQVCGKKKGFTNTGDAQWGRREKQYKDNPNPLGENKNPLMNSN